MSDSFISIPLLQKWFYNLVHDIHNEEILLLIYHHNTKYIYSNYLYFIKEIILKIKKLEPKGKYEILNFLDIANINQIQNNKNIILLSSNLFNSINKLEDCKHKILYFNINKEIYNSILTFTKKTLNDINSTPNYQYYTYISSENPINLIKQEYSVIKNLIFRLFENNNFNDIELLKSDRSMDNRIWKEQIKEEIYLLTLHNILTSKLAIAIYKICTFKFNENNKNIGIFYSKELGIKSKTMHIPNIYGGKKKMFSTKTKAYNLKNSPNVDNIIYLEYIERRKKFEATNSLKNKFKTDS